VVEQPSVTSDHQHSSR